MKRAKIDKYAFQVLVMAAEGYSYRQIAKQFHLGNDTVIDIVKQYKVYQEESA